MIKIIKKLVIIPKTYLKNASSAQQSAAGGLPISLKYMLIRQNVWRTALLRRSRLWRDS